MILTADNKGMLKENKTIVTPLMTSNVSFVLDKVMKRMQMKPIGRRLTSLEAKSRKALIILHLKRKS